MENFEEGSLKKESKNTHMKILYDKLNDFKSKNNHEVYTEEIERLRQEMSRGVSYILEKEYNVTEEIPYEIEVINANEQTCEKFPTRTISDMVLKVILPPHQKEGDSKEIYFGAVKNYGLNIGAANVGPQIFQTFIAGSQYNVQEESSGKPRHLIVNQKFETHTDKNAVHNGTGNGEFIILKTEKHQEEHQKNFDRYEISGKAYKENSEQGWESMGTAEATLDGWDIDRLLKMGSFDSPRDNMGHINTPEDQKRIGQKVKEVFPIIHEISIPNAGNDTIKITKSQTNEKGGYEIEAFFDNLDEKYAEGHFEDTGKMIPLIKAAQIAMDIVKDYEYKHSPQNDTKDLLIINTDIGPSDIKTYCSPHDVITFKLKKDSKDSPVKTETYYINKTKFDKNPENPEKWFSPMIFSSVDYEIIRKNLWDLPQIQNFFKRSQTKLKSMEKVYLPIIKQQITDFLIEYISQYDPDESHIHIHIGDIGTGSGLMPDLFLDSVHTLIHKNVITRPLKIHFTLQDVFPFEETITKIKEKAENLNQKHPQSSIEVSFNPLIGSIENPDIIDQIKKTKSQVDYLMAGMSTMYLEDLKKGFQAMTDLLKKRGKMLISHTHKKAPYIDLMRYEAESINDDTAHTTVGDQVGMAVAVNNFIPITNYKDPEDMKEIIDEVPHLYPENISTLSLKKIKKGNKNVLEENLNVTSNSIKELHKNGTNGEGVISIYKFKKS